MDRPPIHQTRRPRRGDPLTTTLHLPVFFSSDTALVEDEAHHHLFKVKRLQVGERLRIVDGQGHARWARITGIDKRAARLELGEAAPGNEPGRAVEVFVAAPKPDRASWMVEKLTELGVVAIHFVSTARQARGIESSQLARLRRIAVSAVEQCGRSVVPQLTLPDSLPEAITGAHKAELAVAVLDASGTATCPIAAAAGRVGLFVGPEGGWSPEEIELFHERQVAAWALGPTVLRIETAAVVATGQVLAGGGISR